jgi:ABC-type uncharacterized transport system ATPase subunit
MNTIENADTSQQQGILDCNELSMDCAVSQLIIEKSLNRCAESGLPRLIGIEGVSGSGKTHLANALADNLDNALLIDMWSLRNERGNVNKMAIIPDMTNSNIAYIIDETGYCNLDQLNKAIDTSGTFILFFQSFEDAPKTLLQKLQRFNLSFNDGLIMLKAH